MAAGDRPYSTSRASGRRAPAPQRRRGRGRGVALAALVLAAAAVAAVAFVVLRASSEPGPGEKLDAFLEAWQGGEDPVAAELTDRPA